MEVSKEMEEWLGETFGKEYAQTLLIRSTLPPSQTTLRVNTHAVPMEDACLLLQAVLNTPDPQVVAVEEASGASLSRSSLKWEVGPHRWIPDMVSVTRGGGGSGSEYGGEPEGLAGVLLGAGCATLLRGGHVYVPGVMVVPAWKGVGDRVDVYLDHGTKSGPIGTDNDGSILHAPDKIYLGVGRMALSGSEIVTRKMAKEGGVAIVMEHAFGPVLSGVFSSFLYPMNASSASVAHLALAGLEGIESQGDPLRVLDMCAAPGGKTCHLGSMLARHPRGGHVWACERSANRAAKLEGVVERMMLREWVTPIKVDSTKLNKPKGKTAKMLPIGSFDVVVLDPLCSGIGLRPQFTDINQTPESLHQMAGYQTKLGRVAVDMLKPGGILTYSTCTVDPLECEGVVAALVSECGLEVLNARVWGEGVGGGGMEGYGLGREGCGKVCRFDPCGDGVDTPAFFVARLRKPMSSSTSEASAGASAKC